MGDEARGMEAVGPGTVLLEKYRVLRELGVGGMSRVLAAEHMALRTKVAIKLLLPDLASLPDSPQRFEREALAATRIEGEHVARVLDVGTLPAPGPGAGTPFMVMEYLEGKDLARLLKEGTQFSVPHAISLVVQAADALSRGHEAGVVHRDVKPSNLFLTQRSDGSPLVKVLDFGISKVVEDAAQDNLALTKTTAVMGSALYMSLEQMRSTKTVDRRTDVWALGVTLYELYTHTHPWTAEAFSELCVKVSLDPPVPLRKHRPDVPAKLARVIEVAYARAPEQRYQSIGQLVNALAPFATPETRQHIQTIVERERRLHPDLPDPVRPNDGPGRLAWIAYATLGGVLVAAAAAAAMGWRPGQTTSGGGPDAAATATATGTSTVAGSSTTIPSAIPDASADAAPDASAAPGPDGGVIQVSVDAGTAKPDAGVVKHDPCAGKPPGTLVRMPNGLMKPCGMGT